MTKDFRELILKMIAENPTWGAPRIYGELVILGLDISERSVSRWMGRVPRIGDSRQRWLTSHRNHREAIAAMDFFTVPTATFSVLTAFSSLVMIGGAFSASMSPTTPRALGSCSSYGKPFLFEPSAKFLILDHEAKYATEVPAAIREMAGPRWGT